MMALGNLIKHHLPWQQPVQKRCAKAKSAQSNKADEKGGNCGWHTRPYRHFSILGLRFAGVFVSNPTKEIEGKKA